MSWQSYTTLPQFSFAARQNNSRSSSSSAAQPSHLREQAREDLREQAREDRRNRRIRREERSENSRVLGAPWAQTNVLGTFEGLKDGRKFGFLSVEDGSGHCFAHLTDNPLLRGLQVGQPILFDMEWDFVKCKYFAVRACPLVSEDEPEEVAMVDAMDGIDAAELPWRKKRRLQ